MLKMTGHRMFEKKMSAQEDGSAIFKRLMQDSYKAPEKTQAPLSQEFIKQKIAKLNTNNRAISTNRMGPRDDD